MAGDEAKDKTPAAMDVDSGNDENDENDDDEGSNSYDVDTLIKNGLRIGTTIACKWRDDKYRK
tara:strand:- start:1009 stop:1197 length:189 start_codon:yes stop_codon:yes gene_type:complete